MSIKKTTDFIDFTIVKTLGTGSYGKVEEIISHGQRYAKKTYKDLNCPSAIRELSFLNSVSHPNIINIEKIIYKNGMISSIMELCDETLDSYFQFSRSEEDLIEIFHSILCVLEFMHSKNFVHGDLNVFNVLMKYGVVKVSDFGMTRIGDKKNLITTNMCAPEVFTKSIFTTAIDIWGFGTIAFDCLTGHVFAEGNSWEETSKSTLKRMGCPDSWKYKRFCTGEDQNLLENCVLVDYCAKYKNTNQYNDMFLRCFQFDEKDRPTATQLLEYPMFKNLKRPEFKWLSRLPRYIRTPNDERINLNKIVKLFPDEDNQKITHLVQLVSAAETRMVLTHDRICACYYIISVLDDNGYEKEKIDKLELYENNFYIRDILCEFDFKLLQTG